MICAYYDRSVDSSKLFDNLDISEDPYLVSWNEAAPKYDLRDWAPNHEKMGKGITLTAEEIERLKEALDKIGE